jgi:hypothetical protein
VDEAEWDACRDPGAMLRFLRAAPLPPAGRALRLFAVACVRRAAPAHSTPDVAEEYAEGRATVDALWGEPGSPGGPAEPVLWGAAALTGGSAVTFAEAAAARAADLIVSAFPPPGPPHAREDEWAVQARLLRCVVGSPFRPVRCDPAWRTAEVLRLAETVAADRAFDRLPVLADLVEEVGATDAALLAHLRGPGPHALGCHALDAVLDKE